MKNLKVSILSASLLLIICLGLFTINSLSVQASSKEKIISFHAQVKPYEKLAELEKEATIIVQGVFTGERKSNPLDLSKGKLFSSDSMVEVKRVIKGDLEGKENIIVYEPGYIRDEDSTFVTIDGYTLLNERGKYTLFLKPVDGLDGYAIVGLFQGKYNHDIQKSGNKVMPSFDLDQLAKVDYFGEHVQQFNQLKEEVLNKYSWE